MFQFIGKTPFVLAACLLWGAFMIPMAVASPIGASVITGEYKNTTLGDQPENLPVIFSVTNGAINAPPTLLGFTVPDETVEIFKPNPPPTPTPPPSLSTYNFQLVLPGSGPPVETISWSINPASVAISGPTSDFIDAEMTLTSNNTGFDLTSFDTAFLTLDFSKGKTSGGGGISFDPSWSGFLGPVPFDIIAVPEPASIVHLTWVVALGAMSYRRRYHRFV